MFALKFFSVLLVALGLSRLLFRISKSLIQKERESGGEMV